jgi:formylglycine-generating enzyme required for sulfatase activity
MILTAAVAACYAVVAQADVFNMGPGITSLETVQVGNINNAADSTGYGSVGYAYNISKNETTISQYAAFLNAVAKTDTYNLYSSGMTGWQVNGISQSGSSGSFVYSVTAGSGNKPITHVSWFDAARFSNWMHNDQPSGAQDASTTERGAYTLDGATSGVSVSKNVGAKFWIPSEDEWYKAAYYDPNKGGASVGGYWMYPTQSDTLNGNTVGVADSANYDDGDYVGYPGMALTDVGAYGLNSGSFYGTNDQGGNVWEWNDAVIPGSYRGLRGGGWNNSYYNLAASTRNFHTPTDEDWSVGFRVASVPEPGSLAMLLGLALSALWYGCRRRG